MLANNVPLHARLELCPIFQFQIDFCIDNKFIISRRPSIVMIEQVNNLPATVTREATWFLHTAPDAFLIPLQSSLECALTPKMQTKHVPH